MLFDEGNAWTAIAHITTAVIGSGVLSLSWNVAQLGWIAGIKPPQIANGKAKRSKPLSHQLVFCNCGSGSSATLMLRRLHLLQEDECQESSSHIHYIDTAKRPSNAVLEGACERVIVGDLYCDISLVPQPVYP
ncbi:hypothetical protein CTI12_AA281510 [Artemisia annua]|uniref:Amino acid transporter transmembrane domain-containing protein n=1 Tax=Artemisia annua TaxID=35608 RepID=A0A2U1NCT6_ARTAN|nr:hypothetical protein CTI12_AA281510 [Artemisia annua]